MAPKTRNAPSKSRGRGASGGEESTGRTGSQRRPPPGFVCVAAHEALQDQLSALQTQLQLMQKEQLRQSEHLNSRLEEVPRRPSQVIEEVRESSAVNKELPKPVPESGEPTMQEQMKPLCILPSVAWFSLRPCQTPARRVRLIDKADKVVRSTGSSRPAGRYADKSTGRQDVSSYDKQGQPAGACRAFSQRRWCLQNTKTWSSRPRPCSRTKTNSSTHEGEEKFPNFVLLT